MKNAILLAQTEAVQHRTSDPQVSAFVLANAGSGKTHVLTQRVLRLLLANTPPSKILCLTYTKTAAANMSARVFDTLAGWTALDAARLRAEIVKTGAPDPDSDTLKLARLLFARTVETPGGLKIQTIHAFCERLLHLFPFEANVPAQFEQADETRQAALLATAQRHCLAHAPQSPVLTSCLKTIARHASQAEFAKALRDALKLRVELRDAMRACPLPDAYGQGLAKRLGLQQLVSVADVQREILEGGIARHSWRGLALRMQQGTLQDKKRAATLLQAAAHGDDGDAVADYFRFYFGEKNNPLKSLATKALLGIYPDLADLLQGEQDRLEGLRDKLKAARTLERSVALVTVLDDVLRRYENLKVQAGLLDFDDLIARTLGLLTRSDAAWVLYKLDAGIDHVLVDEAQDTSPNQWRILEQITADFNSGAGARSVKRTFFAVGDEKQSIFSFQGAAPQEFDRMRQHFAKTNVPQQDFVDARLENSFRSAAAIVQSVDRIFSLPENYAGLTAGRDDKRTVHQNIKLGLPGIVELWPVVGTPPRLPLQGWSLPTEASSNASAAAQLAGRIAGLIASWLAPASPERVADKATGEPRRIAAGDVMILVRSRSAFFELMIRALKQAGVPVAGADRLRIFEHLAVEDLAAAARVALLPDDDLTLACVLKSPLVGLDENALMRLALHRPGSLWQALHNCDEFSAAAQQVASWKARAAQTPFAFFAHILGPAGGKRQLLARLGAEAEDALDEFLRFALEWQSHNPPTLSAFVAALRDAELEVKRDLEAAGDMVRVMTVHGAKGLESKIVFLPDTCGLPNTRLASRLYTLGDPALIAWAGNRPEECHAMTEARNLRETLQADEFRRLLYVAATRAEERLYIAGYAKGETLKAGCWYDMIEKTLVADLAPAPAPWGEGDTVLRREDGWPAGLGEAPAAKPDLSAAVLPDWLLRPAPLPQPERPPLRPSRALAQAFAPDAAPSGNASPRAQERGKLVHALLQHLPTLAAPRHAEAARLFLTVRAPWLPPAEAEALVGEVAGVLTDPSLSQLFGPQSLAEAAITGHVHLASGEYRQIAGTIDRLAVTPTEVILADFKTGTIPAGASPPGYVLQLALYAAVLKNLYPGKLVRALLVWTAGPRVDEHAAAVLDAGLAAFRPPPDDPVAQDFVNLHLS